MTTPLPRRLAASVTLLGLLGLSACGSQQPQEDSSSSAAADSAQSGGAEAEAESGAAAVSDADVDTSTSTDVVVNKARPLDPEDYAPEPLEDIEGQQLREDAAGAAQQMLSDMRDEGLTVSITSAYRPYDEQVTTYQHWVDVNGQETADTISARPGHSEHQTGLVMDIADGSGCDLQECFADTAAAQWAAEHGQDYGFVLRYSQDGEDVTGYAYEPWHFRYIGEERAQEFADSGAATLEEFYGTGPAPDYS
ncbi:M15 family metallopeptidase [Kocuria palustris]|uniref:M15 family metallopeptidase n=1 Tax=Kocuria palustris TaxID=71999 RepID=UPI00344CD046